jgi:hypothetical protein
MIVSEHIIKENIKTSAKEGSGLYELKQNDQWFNEECSRFLNRRMHAKMQWLRDPCQIKLDNLNNVRYAASRHFRNKMKEYLRAKINSK